MKNLSKIIVLLLCMAFITSIVTAQKKRQPSRSQPNTATQIKASAEKISDQIINLTRFLFVLGSVASGIEEIDQQAKQGKASKALIEKNTEFKLRTTQSIRDIKTALAAIEVEFRTKSFLKKYQNHIQGITETAILAEELATSGKFMEAGKTLIAVVEKLANTLVLITSTNP